MRLALLACVALVAGCGGRSSSPAPAAPAPAPARRWQTTLDASHPLVGRIWSVREGRFVDERAMLAALHGYVLLGEKHDNPDHHALQAEVLAALVAKGERPAVAFEMLDRDAQAKVDAARRAAPRDPEAIARAVDWERSGWPAFRLYAPVVKVALDAGLPILATGLPRSEVHGIVHGAAAALDEGPPLTAEQEASLAEELRADHCGMLPEAILPGMIRVQRARDAAMARVLASAAKTTHDAVLFAGNGHTRLDRGVGRDLRALDPSRDVFSVAFAEVEAGKTAPESYASRWNAARLPFDFVWFTPRANDDDPCAGMRR